jgi:hypothetical protein
MVAMVAIVHLVGALVMFRAQMRELLVRSAR